ncbi:NAD-dependent epimerase/dehydratase family protein [Candidatus Pelagibacter communis]|uniref:NAD-dependent epimerase/dehydratase family protein n=1 Tax=Pelagibacter ubique TaxID=198252 RepID=UPI00094CCD23|nr:NAD-dependent epimerase/dehydratase family protein [Candidatus Pelagibacter ubique]
MIYLVTGSAGFIGFHTAKRLLEKKNIVIGVDNLNRYYDPKLKLARNKILKKYKKYKFHKIDISNKKKIDKLFKKEKVDVVINLAAQAGVRYSIINPSTYIKSNLNGFFNIIQNCVEYKVKKLIFASSSSIYGVNKNPKFKESFITDSPIQLYAATKKSNELIAHSYSSLFDLKCIGLRFFTVYGPWGRPDMSLFKFVKNIKKKKHIEIYNQGNHLRDFTYIDDCVSGIINTLNYKMKKKFEIFNIGSEKPIKLINFIKIIEDYLKIKAKKKFLGLQMGDTIRTSASISKISKATGYKPKTSIKKGVHNFINWYNDFYR